MNSCVLDASVALAWCFEEEHGEEGERLLERIRGARLVVPSLWSLEVSNVMLLAERRGSINAADAQKFLGLLRALNPDVDGETGLHVWSDTLPLARRYNLTTYDAAYLELAIRLDASLASFDETLCAAARACGVELLA